MKITTETFSFDGKDSFDGSRGWMSNFRLADEPSSLRDVVNTLMVQRFQHHYPVVAGDWHDELMECAAWLDVKPLERVPYKRYMQNTIIQDGIL